MRGLTKHCLRFVLRCQRLWIADRFKYFSQNLFRHLRFGFYSLDNVAAYFPDNLFSFSTRQFVQRFSGAIAVAIHCFHYVIG